MNTGSSIQFFNNTLPGLEAGTYTITVTPTLDVAGSQGDTTPISQPFIVQGPRFVLPTSDVYVQSPSSQSSGEFDTQLPYILLNSATLPWERRLSPGSQTTTPWVALLVFEEGELPTPLTTTTVGKFLASGSATTLVPQLPTESVSTQEQALTCQIIQFPAALFKQIAPTIDELSLLAHCRQTNNAQQQGNSYGAVLANRFPKAMKGCYIDVLLDMPSTTQPNGFILSKNAQGTWQLVYINASNNIGQPISADIIEQLTPGYTNALNTLINVIGNGNPAELSSVQTAPISSFLRSYYNQAINPQAIIQPVNNIVHLVSLEGCESYLSPDYSPEEGQVIQLISLSSWSFICMPYIDQNFGQLLTQLMTNTQTGDNIPLLRMMPSPSDAANSDATPETLSYLTNGYTPHLYKTLSGETTLGWYRGPLSPVIVPQIPALPFNSTTGEELFIYNADTGIYDVSYAAAWQIGRQLALADATFTQALMAFFRSTMTTVQSPAASVTKQTLVGHLQNGLTNDIGRMLSQPPINQASRLFQARPNQIKATPNQRRHQQLNALKTASSMAIPSTIVEYLASLRRFSGLPFSYLISDEKLLPTESIRFFHVDTNWLDAMTAGALTIGVHNSGNKIISGTLFDQLRTQGFNQADPVCGFFLRSAVVSGWPDLRVETNVTLLSSVQLAPDVLFCLFDGIPQQLTLGEPHHQLSFGVSGDTIDTGFIELRQLTGDVGTPLASNNQLNIATVFRAGGDRVIDFSNLTNALTTAHIHPSSGTSFSSSDIAIELIRSPEEVTFILSSTLTTGVSLMLTTNLQEGSETFSDEPLLQYEITSISTQIQINEPVTLTITVDNTSINPTIALQELDIQLPIGSDAADLTSDFSGLGYTVNPADVWKISPNASTNTFVIKPKSGTPQSITGQSLSITISGTVNQQLGACNFYLTEMTGTDPNSPNCAFSTLSVTKSLDGFSLTNFMAKPTNICSSNEIPTPVSLTWKVCRVPGCSLSLSWPGTEIDVTDYSSYPNSEYPANLILPETTTFTLKALVPTSSGGNVPFQLQTTVSVTEPSISQILGTIVGDSPQLILGGADILSWTTQLINTCSLYTTAGASVASDIPPDANGIYRYPVSPQQTTSYYVEGVDVQKASHQSQSFEVRVYANNSTPIIIGTAISFSFFGLQFSSDQSHLLALRVNSKREVYLDFYPIPIFPFASMGRPQKSIDMGTMVPYNFTPNIFFPATSSALTPVLLIETELAYFLVSMLRDVENGPNVTLAVVDKNLQQIGTWSDTFEISDGHTWSPNNQYPYYWDNDQTTPNLSIFTDESTTAFCVKMFFTKNSGSLSFTNFSIFPWTGGSGSNPIGNIQSSRLISSDGTQYFLPTPTAPAMLPTEFHVIYPSLTLIPGSGGYAENMNTASNEVKEDQLPRRLGFFNQTSGLPEHTAPNPPTENNDSNDVDSSVNMTYCCTIH